MEWMIANTSWYQRMYNCSIYSVDEIPLSQRQKVGLGVLFIAIGTIEMSLYLPCMVVLWKLARTSSCYRLMFAMGVMDILCLPICTIATGIFGITGAVYCSSPTLIFVLGAMGMGLWMGETSLEVAIAVNRCVELLCPEYVIDILYGGWRICPWILGPTLYALFIFFFEQPVLFTGLHFAWFLDPHTGYLPASFGLQYTSLLHVIHNSCIFCSLCSTYGLFAVNLCYKLYQHSSLSGAAQNRAMIFLQVALISAVNAGCASIYLYMQYYPTSDGVILLAQFFWTQAHGIPPVIYLVMNRTVRKECLELFRIKKNNNQGAVSPINVIIPPIPAPRRKLPMVSK